jgi:hypothetical protein
MKEGKMKEPFTTFDISKILDLKIDLQKDWRKRDYIEPSIQKATGQGTKNLFSIEDIYLIALFQHLIELGFAREVAAGRIKSIKNVHVIANEVHRIRVTKLNAAGLAQIKRDWARLDDIDFIVIGWTPNAITLDRYADLPPIKALRFADSENRDRIEIAQEQYADVDDIILINFKKIRSKVDLAIAND